VPEFENVLERPADERAEGKRRQLRRDLAMSLDVDPEKIAKHLSMPTEPACQHLYGRLGTLRLIFERSSSISARPAALSIYTSDRNAGRLATLGRHTVTQRLRP